MDAITKGHWIYAVVATGIYILYLAWAYRKEAKVYKKFNFNSIKVFIYTVLIILFIYFTS